jgi:hypothetical protein
MEFSKDAILYLINILLFILAGCALWSGYKDLRASL